MWTLFLLASLAIGVASLGWGIFSEAKGWERIGQFGAFLFRWLPLAAAPSIVILCALVAKAGWRWTFVAGILFLLGAVQWGLLVVLGDSRWPYCFMPLVLICLSGIALLRRNHAAVLPAPPWMQQAAVWLAVLGLILIAGAYGARARESRKRAEDAESLRLEDARKDRTSRGLARAAWLLGREFSSQDGYSEAEFIRTGLYSAPRSGGEYRWDEIDRRLSVTRTLFGELSCVRERVLPVAKLALQSKALRPGPRADFGGGVLDCAPPLACTMVWKFEVEPLRPDARPLRGAVDAWVTGMELSVQKELFPPVR